MADTEQPKEAVYHRAFWMTFEKSTPACVEAAGVTDAIKLAEELRKDKVTKIRGLPYPAMPRLTNHVQPTGDVTPAFCYRPEQCAGRSSCPQRRSCTD